MSSHEFLLSVCIRVSAEIRASRRGHGVKVSALNTLFYSLCGAFRLSLITVSQWQKAYLEVLKALMPLARSVRRTCCLSGEPRR